jgi:hypothetical protein
MKDHSGEVPKKGIKAFLLKQFDAPPLESYPVLCLWFVSTCYEYAIQAKLAAAGGSQCGYCSPGMVMQLDSWLKEHPTATMEEIDNILDGNICRYRIYSRHFSHRKCKEMLK